MSRTKTLQERLQQYPTHKAMYLFEKSTYNRNTRINNRTKQILNKEGFSYLITLTLTDESIKKISLSYLFRKVKEAMRTASLYIANEDYGSERGRLHFHVLASFNEQLDYTKTNPIGQVWKYGGIDYQPIHTKNDKALSKYLTKLTNHAIKDTAKKIIFSRGFEV